MKKRYILSPLAIAAGAIIWMSASSGVAKSQQKDRTGSPVSDLVCSSCHSSGSNFSTTAVLTVIDDGGALVTEYIPGQTYTLSLVMGANGNHMFGFQVTGLLDDNSAGGVLSAATGGAQITGLNDRQYFEHSGALGGSLFTATWEAPAAGSGDVTFYGSALGVNNDGTTMGDEYVNIQDLTISESTTNSVDERSNSVGLRVFPNPAVNELNITLHGKIIKGIDIFSVTGAEMLQVTGNSSREVIDVTLFPKGSYFIRIWDGKNSYVSRFVKR